MTKELRATSLGPSRCFRVCIIGKRLWPTIEGRSKRFDLPCALSSNAVHTIAHSTAPQFSYIGLCGMMLGCSALSSVCKLHQTEPCHIHLCRRGLWPIVRPLVCMVRKLNSCRMLQSPRLTVPSCTRTVIARCKPHSMHVSTTGLGRGKRCLLCLAFPA